MMTTEIIRELGEDPDKVCSREEHIVLKLENPWPISTSSSSSSTLPELPKGLSHNGDGRLITTTADAFVENCSFLCEHRVVGALFAGCASFDKCRPLGAATRAVLSDVQTLVIVHNQDFVRTLVDLFRSVEVLVLHHDMRLQVSEEDWGDIDGAPPQLKRLIGSTPALGMQNLFLSKMTIFGLLSNCPYLCELQTSLHEILSPANPLVSMLLAVHPSLHTTRSLTLGEGVERLDGMTGIFWDITRGHMDQANKFFLNLRRIQVTTTHSQTIAAIGIFEQLTDVSLMFIAQGTLGSFQGLVENTLKRLQLEHLSLKFVKDVSLRAVAEHWPRLQTLSLAECSVVDYDVDDILPGSFAGLVKLQLGSKITIHALEVLLGTARRLVSLQLEGDLLVASFVICSLLFSFLRLERLVLGTKQSLPALTLTGNNLRYLIKALPALQYVATDSYDLRVFFENYMPWVTLGWGHCTTCAAEFPLVDATQREFWQKVVTPCKRRK
ncbi:hypothetical protein HPB49_013471 [Dermacentor silvarum]|uniref:Uncharacterized protein n=1 Tax=Dermacentor silvarum TaxID=543639 RepID=A0ACB8E1E6_DERSI|nr:hypothetical protein HPB49_013471 [Dermacentor silvarum]